MRTRPERRHESGQALVMFIVVFLGLAAMAGLLIDGGLAWVNRREAQTAADLAALAAGKAVADAKATCNASGRAIATAAAQEAAALNGFTSVSVAYPATGTAAHNGCDYIRVSVSRPMNTTFSRVLGHNQWTAGASAVTKVTVATLGNVKCNFCSLNNTDKNHTLLVQVGSTLIVDGEIYVNSSNGNSPTDPNSPVKMKDWHVGGDGFDIFGTGGRIEADYINVVGGWETHDSNIAVARNAKCDASKRPDPLAYQAMSPPLTSNVCIRQPVLADPLAAFPTPNISDYPVRSTRIAKYASATTYTIDPGVYIGGIEVAGSAHVIMNPGVYYLAGGGLDVSGNASITGKEVMIYSAAAGTGKKSGAGAVDIETNGTVTLSPMPSGQFAGMTIFLDRTSNEVISLKPSNTAQCASVAAAGEPQGCIGGISGTLYAPNWDATVIVKAAGTANLQVISGKMLIQNGSTARFTYKAGLATTAFYSYELVE
jgi:Flp pilus assembly protein TadG